MSLEANKALVRRMLDWWVGGDASVLDETNAEDCVRHESGGAEVAGRDACKERLSGFINFFSDRTLTIEDMVAEGDRVAVRYSWTGVSRDGRHVASASMLIFRIEGGRIAEEWEEHDTAGLTKQLGMG